MARAICTKCGKEFRWYGGRGMKLTDIQSPCCRVQAKGKSGNRTPRVVHPSITVQAQRGLWGQYCGNGQWHLTDFKARFSLLPDGRLLTSWKFMWRAILMPTEQIEDGWRLFEHKPWHNCRIREEDWQMLLAKSKGDS